MKMNGEYEQLFWKENFETKTVDPIECIKGK